MTTAKVYENAPPAHQLERSRPVAPTFYCKTCGYHASVFTKLEEIKCWCDMCKSIQIFTDGEDHAGDVAEASGAIK